MTPPALLSWPRLVPVKLTDALFFRSNDAKVRIAE